MDEREYLARQFEPNRTQANATTVFDEVNTAVTTLAILTLQIFPLALPALVFVIVPLVLLAIVGLLLAGIVVLPLWLARLIVRKRPRRGPARPASVPDAVGSRRSTDALRLGPAPE